MVFFIRMGILFVVATPIGNLKDITFRAIETLKSVDLIACEDTRLTKRLLDAYQISTKTISYHQHSQLGKIDFIIKELLAGKSVALVSDAGTPGISDPGGLLVKAAWEQGIKVESIPGPSAVVTALSVSGVPTDKFLFLGFLPHKKGRETLMKQIIDSEITVVFYESVHRIEKALEQLKKFGLDRNIVVGRELTKQFETIYRGTVDEIAEQLREHVKGEFVVIVPAAK